ncbi:MAG TPA: PfkB family carbohydrate kinase, partial [Ktedonobacterales bacterium]|nr:PfkB family carbohydrate kinase [Ktedonobacterales bacterium]
MCGRVIVLGSLMTDLVGYAARLPTPGESLPGVDFQTFLGGKGCNQAVAAARSGAQVALIGRIGADAFGEGFFSTLATEGVDAAHVTRTGEAGTGVALIVIGADTGQNMILALPRANLTVTPDETIHALDALARAENLTPLSPSPTRKGEARMPGVFLAQLETNLAAVEAGLRHAHALGLTTLLNTAPAPTTPLAADVFPLVDILIANEAEAMALTGV